MADLDQLLERAATRLQPTSDAWERMQARATRRRRRRRVEAFTVATLVGIAGVGIAVGAFDSGPNTPAPATQTPIVPGIGNGLIWAVEGGGEGGTYLSTIDPATGASKVLFNDGIRPAAGGVSVLAAIGSSYAWSPDGKRLALSAYSGKGSKIYLLPPSGMSRTQVTFGGGLASYPSWSPDGRHIAYASDTQPATGSDSPYYTPGCELSLKLCPQQIRVTNANPRANSLARQLTHDPVGATMPSWSPDGQRIAFVGGATDPNGDIYVMDANGHNVRPLTSGPAYDSFPKWSPDGTRIAFFRAGSGQPSGVWIMNADGTNPHPLAASGPQTGSFAWSPDGTELAFATQTGITLITPSGDVLKTIAVNPILGGVGDLVWRPLPPASSFPQAPLSAQIVLPSNTMTAGSSISGQVIVVNNTGRAIHGGDCGTPFAIRLVNDTVKASVGWPTCLQTFTIPKGQSSWPVSVTAMYSACGGGTRPCVGGRPPSLPPGYYRATLFQAPHVVSRPAPITILVTP